MEIKRTEGAGASPDIEQLERLRIRKWRLEVKLQERDGTQPGTNETQVRLVIWRDTRTPSGEKPMA